MIWPIGDTGNDGCAEESDSLNLAENFNVGNDDRKMASNFDDSSSLLSVEDMLADFDCGSSSTSQLPFPHESNFLDMSFSLSTGGLERDMIRLSDPCDQLQSSSHGASTILPLDDIVNWPPSRSLQHGAGIHSTHLPSFVPATAATAAAAAADDDDDENDDENDDDDDKNDENDENVVEVEE
jgi:hypothetical protein